MTAQPISNSRISQSTLVVVGFLGIAVVWSYWTTLANMAWRWWEDPQYSHGYIVPAFAAYLLWLRRDRIRGQTLEVTWLGVGLIVIAATMRLGGTYTAYEYFDQVSLLPCCAGLFMLAGGWPALMWAWPAIAFLAFMVPLPDRVSLALSAPMQALATTASTFALQVCGRPAIAEGNVILLDDAKLDVVEACSGLRMLVVFFALSTAVAMLIRKPLWEKLLIAGSAIPIALVSNILRITITGLLCDTFGNEYSTQFHDYSGLAMMPIGMVFLLIELWILKTLLIERSTDLSNAVSLQRVDVNPVALYGSGQTPRRKKAVAPKAPPKPEIVETVPVAEPAIQA